MKKSLVFIIFGFLVVAVNCSEQEEPLICHLYGYMLNDISQTGVNGRVVRIYDLNPYDVHQARLRYDTTTTQDSVAGYFEMDSVCYGTNKRQGNLVTIGIDASENPGWPNQYYTPDIYGAVDTVYIYILPGK